MRIGIVGGLDRSERAFRDVAERFGLEVVFHTGDVRGRGTAALLDLVATVELVIVVTDVNTTTAHHVATMLVDAFDRAGL